MPLPARLDLVEIASHYVDVDRALRLYFSPLAPDFVARFVGKTQDEVQIELNNRLAESDLMLGFTVLASLEASFQVDFKNRCKSKHVDDLSIHFRRLQRERKNVRFDDILQGWKDFGSIEGRWISELRAAFRWRNWIAHGRHYVPKLGRSKYDFADIYFVGTNILSNFPFEA